MKRIILLLVAVITVSGLAMSQNAAKINVSKKAVTVNLQPNEVSTQTLTLKNQGGENLNFTIVDIETSRSMAQGTASVSSANGDLPAENLSYLLDRAKTGAQDAAWLKVGQANNSIVPSGASDIQITLDATGLAPDIYTARLLVSSNDVENPYEIVPVTMAVLGPTSICQAFTTTDNENNAGTGTADGDMDNYLCRSSSIVPIEFNLFLDEPAPITSAQLNIYAYDIDESAGEIDGVYFNGTYLGDLTGNNGQWSTTVFSVPVGLIVAGPGGKNTVKVTVDDLNGGWCVEVDFAELLVNGCSGGNAFLRYALLDQTCYIPGSTVEASIEVDSDLASQTVRVETNLLNENNIAVDGFSNTFTVSLTADEPLVVNLDIPNGANLGVTYNVQVIVYDVATNLQQDYRLLPLLVNDPCTSVPVSNWAIVLGVFLIGAFMVIRYRRRRLA